MKLRGLGLAAVLMTLAVPAGAQDAPQPPPTPPPAAAPRQKVYTAQQKPRVAVMQFENTNQLAKEQKYGESVSAMLITFLKRKSQLVVVERQNLDKVLNEWKLEGSGATAPENAEQKKELEVIDAILDGRVTVLGDKGNEEVEIDARLISKDDAHIISAGHQRGKTATLRNVVEMLGIELEHGFLRPYYGSLTVTVTEPTNARIFLTPVLSVNASDDEKPPIELDQTVSPQAQQILYDKWVTVPTVATISNLLGGYYTIRIDRPGYEGVSTDNSKMVVQDSFGQMTPRQINGDPLKPEQQRFLVQITPFETKKWPADNKPITLVKKGGSITVQARREFLEREYKPTEGLSELKTYVRAETSAGAAAASAPALLEINNRDDLTGAIANADGPVGPSVLVQKKLDPLNACEYKSGQGVFEDFLGGRILVEDYHKIGEAAGKKLPVGSYRVYAAMPNYAWLTSPVFDVADKVDDRVVQLDLRRLRGTVTVMRTEAPSPEHHIVLEGTETKYKQTVALDFTGKKTINDLPVDTYTVTTDQPGFNEWRGTFTLTATNVKPIVDEDGCAVTAARPPVATFAFDLKTQAWLAGRLTKMNKFSNDSLSRRPDFSDLLDQLMKAEEGRRPATGAAANDALLVGRSQNNGDVKTQQLNEYMRLYLRQIDLLYLDDSDVKRLLKLPQTAEMIRTYISRGGAVFCFISEPGDFSSLFGTTLTLDPKPEEHGELELRQGDVSQIQLDLKVEFPQKRTFPTLRFGSKEPLGEWRVVAFRRKGRKEPAIVEYGDLNTGGYVLAWLDSIDKLEDHQLTQQAFATVEKRAIAWSIYLMYRRLGPNSQDRREAQDRLQTLSFNARGEGKIVPPK